MKKSSFNQLCKEYTQVKVALFIGVSKAIVSRHFKLKYPPPDWDYNLSMLSGNKYKVSDFVQDRCNFKPNSKPMVNKKQVRSFLKEHGKLQKKRLNHEHS